MGARSNQKTAVVALFCSDPRIRAAASVIDACIKKTLNVDYVIAKEHDGIVRLYRDPLVFHRPRTPEELCRGDFGMDDIDRLSLEHWFKRHMDIHNIVGSIIGTHEDCKGCRGAVEQHKQWAVVAANVFGRRMEHFSYTAGTRPVHFALRGECDWDMQFLN